MPLTCPLCRSQHNSLFCRDQYRPYHQCGDCSLVFVPPEFHLTEQQEKAEYDLHRNCPQDSGYRNFLSRLFEPLRQRLPAGAAGLDFGSGPGPTLSLMFQERGFAMELFDKFYADNPQVWQRSYDFITASEVVEHLRDPQSELERLLGRLRNGGILGLMTKLVRDQQAFSSWHYKNDRSHICFFSRKTFLWLAERYRLQVEFIGSDVILLHKKPACH